MADLSYVPPSIAHEAKTAVSAISKAVDGIPAYPVAMALVATFVAALRACPEHLRIDAIGRMFRALEQDGLIKTSEIDAERAQREKSRAR